MAINPDAPIYPEVDTDLLQNGAEPIQTVPLPPYSSPDWQEPNPWVHPEVDVDLLPGVPNQYQITQEQVLTTIIPAVSYYHTQGAVSSSWTITHNLHFMPNVTAFDSGNTQVEGNVIHNSTNSLTIEFSSPISGSAVLS